MIKRTVRTACQGFRSVKQSLNWRICCQYGRIQLETSHRERTFSGRRSITAMPSHLYHLCNTWRHWTWANYLEALPALEVQHNQHNHQVSTLLSGNRLTSKYTPIQSSLSLKTCWNTDLWKGQNSSTFNRGKHQLSPVLRTVITKGRMIPLTRMMTSRSWSTTPSTTFYQWTKARKKKLLNNLNMSLKWDIATWIQWYLMSAKFKTQNHRIRHIPLGR